MSGRTAGRVVALRADVRNGGRPMSRVTPFQARLIECVEADPGRSPEAYARRLDSTAGRVQRTAYLLWERDVLSVDDLLHEPEVHLWPATNLEPEDDAR